MEGFLSLLRKMEEELENRNRQQITDQIIITYFRIPFTNRDRKKTKTRENIVKNEKGR